MRKRVFGRKLKRTTNQRKGLFKSLAQAMVLHGRIKTTEAKAKAFRGEIEKLITIAKKNADAMQFLQKNVPPKTADGIIRIAPLFKDRQGGYTRVIKIGSRKKDNAPMVILEFVEKIATVAPDKPSSASSSLSTSAKASAGKGRVKNNTKKTVRKTISKKK